MSQQTDLKMRALNAGMWVTAVLSEAVYTLSEAAETVALRLEGVNTRLSDRAAGHHYLTFGRGRRPTKEEVDRVMALSIRGEVATSATVLVEEINKFFDALRRPLQ